MSRLELLLALLRELGRDGSQVVRIVRCSVGKWNALAQQLLYQLATKDLVWEAACDSDHNQMKADDVVVVTI